jgi:antitoxin component YwqK of YwqJK toxin-antitoxin module/Tfp pilus assembly protein PilF
MMKRFLNISLFLFVLLSAERISAQMNVDLVNSGEIMQEADLYNSMGKFTKAENLYLKVGRNDTNYARVLRELAFSYSDDKEDSLAYVTARRGKELDSEYKADFYNIMGLSLKEMGKFDTALSTLNEGIRLYPYKYLLFYQKGMVYVKMKKYPEAQECFEKSVELNPYHGPSHYQLGKTCAEQGRVVPAILAYEYFLMMENNTDRAAKVVTELEDLFTGDAQPDPDMQLSSKEANDECFNDIQDLISSQIFLKPEFKNKTVIKLKMVKGLQAMLEKLHYEKNTGNWFMENYVPFFVELQQKNFLAPFASHILYGVQDNPSVAKSVKKNKKKIVVFATWASAYIKEHSKHPARELFTGDPGKLDFTFYDNHVIAGTGQVNASGIENGKWFYFYMRTGHLLSKGNYVNGKRDGEWNWYYDDGTPREKTVFENGSREGASEQWSENGVTSFKCTYLHDMIEGDYSVYSITGQLTETAKMSAGKLNGLAVAYYEDGAKKAELDYVMGKLDGNITFYTIDGKVYKKIAYKNDMKNGHSVETYISGTVKSEGDYKNDEPVGHWKSNWDNGTVFREGDYKDGGLRNGIWNEYYRNGKMSVAAKYVSGKLTGKSEYYDTDGKIFCEKDYAADKLKGESYFDKKGKTIAEYTIKDDYEVTEYYPSGLRAAKGNFYAGERDGDWKIYSENGGWLYAKEHYNNGSLSGNRIEYFQSGDESNELVYHHDERDGYYKSYYQNGTLWQEGWFVDGERQGDWYEYNQRGIVISHRYFLNDVQKGYQEFFDEKGKKDVEDFYREENLWSSTHFDSTGVVSYKSDLTNGNGAIEIKYNNGKICIHQEYKNGVLNGATNRFEYNGVKTIESHYLDGQQHGKRTEYYPVSGKLSLDANYSYDEKHGTVKGYFENGALSYEESYYNGDLDGPQKYYYDNGKMMKEGTWELGKINGELNLYAEDGTLEFRRYYKDGNILGYSYLDKNGEILPMIELENASGKFVAYYPNGNKSIEGEYVNGKFNGKVTEYFTDGKISEDENYKYGDFEGEQKYYYSNGNPKKIQSYNCDELDGTGTYYYENGKMKSLEYYILGDNFGKWSFFNENGDLVKQTTWYDDMQYAEVAVVPAPLNVPPVNSGSPKKPAVKPQTK